MRLTLKTPYRDGTTHMIFEPEDVIAILAALVPKPRAHLTRYHGVLAPASRIRAEVVPSGRGRRRSRQGMAKPEARERTDVERHRAMSWAQRLKRVFRIEITTCWRCGGKLRVIASIEEKPVIDRILDHTGRAGEPLDRAHASRVAVSA